MSWNEGGVFDLSEDSDARDSWAYRGIAIALGAELILALEPSGAGMAAAAISTTVVVPNIVDPEAWISASSDWSDLKNVYDTAQSDILSAASTVGGLWQDSAAEQFHAFVEGELLEILARLEEACGLMDSACAQMAVLIISTMAAYVAATVSAIVAGFAANGTGPFSPAAKWTIFGIWAPFVIGIISALVALLTAIWTSNKTLGDAFDALANKVGEKEGKIDASSIKLPEPVKAVISDYDEWEKKS